jgi:hypothetical protein
MGAAKQALLQEMGLRERLCACREDRHRTERCPRCDELTVCRLCWENGAPALCDYCRHVAGKDD